MAGTRKYNRTGFYDAEKKAWKTFYTAPSGKITVKKFDFYNDLKSDIKKNAGANIKKDIKPKTKSALTQTQINNTVKIQKSIERDIKELSSTGNTNFLGLEKNILTTNYKTEILNNIPREIFPDEKSFLEDSYDISYSKWTYKRPLFIGADSFDKMKYHIDRPNLKPYNKLQLEIGKGKKKITGILNRCDFKTQDKFEDKLKSFVKQDPGLTPRRYEKMKIVIKGIKF